MTAPIQTEKTKKRYKLLKAVAFLLFFFGMIIAGGSIGIPGEGETAVTAAVVMLVSIGLYALARFLSWWHHG